MFRLIVGLVLVLSALLVTCAPAAPTPLTTPIPATPTSVKTGTLRYFELVNPDLRDVPMGLALKQLQQEGYTVQTTQLENATLITEALSRGDADMGQYNNQTAWAAIQKGAKLATIAVPVAGTAIIAARNSLTDCKQLDGKPLALPTNSGVNPTLLNQYLADHCDNAKPQILVLPDINARFAGLENGTLDASLMQRDNLLQLDQQAPGKFALLIPLNKAFPNVVVNGLQVNTDFAKANPELVRDVLRALVLANRAAAENPGTVVNEGIQGLKLEPGFVQKSVDGNLKDNLWDQNGGLTTEKVKGTLDFLIALKSLPAGMTPEQVADLSYLNEVLDELGRK